MWGAVAAFFNLAYLIFKNYVDMKKEKDDELKIKKEVNHVTSMEAIKSGNRAEYDAAIDKLRSQ